MSSLQAYHVGDHPLPTLTGWTSPGWCSFNYLFHRHSIGQPSVIKTIVLWACELCTVALFPLVYQGLLPFAFAVLSYSLSHICWCYGTFCIFEPRHSRLFILNTRSKGHNSCSLSFHLLAEHLFRVIAYGFSNVSVWCNGLLKWV